MKLYVLPELEAIDVERSGDLFYLHNPATDAWTACADFELPTTIAWAAGGVLTQRRALELAVEVLDVLRSDAD